MHTIKVENPNLEAAKPESKPKKKLNWKRLLLWVITLVVIAGIAALVFFVNSRWQKQVSSSFTDNTDQAMPTACVDILNPECWSEAFRPKLEQTNGKTNVLMLGIDTRASGGGAGLMNTDTIMLATYYYDTNQVRLLSFPRDLYAPYGCNAGNLPYKIKINAIYAYGRYHCSDKNGSRVLSQTIEKITGEKINYVAIVKLEGVMKAVDALGGVDVNIPVDHTDVYPYVELPAHLQKTCNRSKVLRAYCIFTFKKGLTHMDGQTALIYARMREYSTDFDRARRQQEVLDAVKDKIKGDKTSPFDKATNLLNLYNSLSGAVELKFDINLETILAGLDIASQFNGSPAKVILDPSFGGGGVIVKGDGSNYNFKDYSFKQVQGKLTTINNYIELYSDKPAIYVSNQTGSALAKDHPLMGLKNAGMWFLNMNVENAKTKNTTKTGIEIIDYSNGQKSSSLKYLMNKLDAVANVVVITANDENGLKPGHKEDIGINIYPLTQPTPTANPSVTP